jgi:hypothetical protein
MESPKITLDIDVYELYGEGYFAQCKYLVHAYNDVLWTNDLDEAMSFLRDSLVKSRITYRGL